MKDKAYFIAVFALAVLLLPMVALNMQLPAAPAQADKPAAQTEQEQPGKQEKESGKALVMALPRATPEAADPPAQRGEQSDVISQYGTREFHILDEQTGEIHRVSVRDYLCGAVAVEMPASFHIEAIKAQAVAAHTYALYQQSLQQKNADPELGGRIFPPTPPA